MKLSDLFESVPTYFFWSVSGLDMSGNLRPTNLGFLKNNASCAGVSGPSMRWMMYNWSISLSPGNRGWPSASSCTSFGSVVGVWLIPLAEHDGSSRMCVTLA